MVERLGLAVQGRLEPSEMPWLGPRRQRARAGTILREILKDRIPALAMRQQASRHEDQGERVGWKPWVGVQLAVGRREAGA